MPGPSDPISRLGIGRDQQASPLARRRRRSVVLKSFKRQCRPEACNSCTRRSYIKPDFSGRGRAERVGYTDPVEQRG